MWNKKILGNTSSVSLSVAAATGPVVVQRGIVTVSMG